MSQFPIVRLPFEESQVNRFFKDLIKGFEESSTLSSAFIPPADIVETAENIALTLELPGFAKDQVHIEINGNILTIKGERRQEKVEQGKIHRQERVYGSFERSFTLPNAAVTDRVTAAFKEGLLTLSIPKQEAAKPKKVTIS